MRNISVDAFENRYRPEEITPAVRKHMSLAEWKSEVIWITCGIVLTAAFGLFFSLAYRVFGEPPKSELPLIGAWVVVALLFLGSIHWRFHRRRKFLREMPAAAAIVADVEVLPEFSDEGAGHIEELWLEYVPGQNDLDAAVLKEAGSVHAKARVGQIWSPFVEHLYTGEMVSVLYDPKHPGKVRVVEEEHEPIAV